MTESQATTRLLHKLHPIGHFWKASDKFRAGVPDIIGCYLGRFVAIEVKIDDGKPTPLQIFTLSEIVRNTGYAALATYSNKSGYWRLGTERNSFYLLPDLIEHLKDRMRFHESDL